MKHLAKSCLLLAFTIAHAGCGLAKAIDSVNSMPGKMEDMKSTLGQTNSNMNVVQEQPVAMAYDDMLKDEYGRYIEPIPYDIIPVSEKFAQYASTDTIVKFVALKMDELNSVQFDPTDTTDTAVKFNKRKTIILTELKAVSGFLSEDKLHDIIKNQILGSGEYRDAALQLLMLRVQFLRDVNLNGILLAKPLSTVGKLDSAIANMDKIEEIGRLPFASEISVNITGFEPPMQDITESMMDSGKIVQLWATIKKKAQRSLKLTLKSLTGDPAQDQQILARDQTNFSKDIDTIDARIRAWGATP